MADGSPKRKAWQEREGKRNKQRETRCEGERETEKGGEIKVVAAVVGHVAKVLGSSAPIYVCLCVCVCKCVVCLLLLSEWPHSWYIKKPTEKNAHTLENRINALLRTPLRARGTKREEEESGTA